MLRLLERDLATSTSVLDKPTDEDISWAEEELLPDFAVDAQMFHNSPALYSEEDFLQLFRIKPSLAEHMTSFLCQASPSHPGIFEFASDLVFTLF